MLVSPVLYNAQTQIYFGKKTCQKSPCVQTKDFLDLPQEDIFKKIKQSMTPQNFVGSGNEADVYKIPNTKYCVRIPHIANDISKFSYTKEITPIDSVNHILAKLGFGTTIMEFFDGKTPKDYKFDKDLRYKFQKQISNMPVKSYTDLLHQIANAIDNEMLFDFAGGNLIVDINNKKLTAIDFYSISDNPKPIKPLTEMYSVLTCYGSEEKTGKKIFNKIIAAALEEFKPNKIPCMDLALFDFESLCFKRCHDSYTKNHELIIQDISRQTRLLKEIKKSEIIKKSDTQALEKNINKLLKLISHIR